MRLCLVLSTIEREWFRIVGNRLAARSVPSSFADGVLVVRVDSQAALADMNFKKGAIIREISLKANLDIADIQGEIGVVRSACRIAPPKSRRATGRAKPKLDEKRHEQLSQEILAEHADLDVRLAECIARCRILSDRGADQ